LYGLAQQGIQFLKALERCLPIGSDMTQPSAGLNAARRIAKEDDDKGLAKPHPLPSLSSISVVRYITRPCDLATMDISHMTQIL
jgi:hypothetical protein